MSQITKVTGLLFIIHTMVLVFIISSILNNGEMDWAMYWMVLLPIDLPAFGVSYITSPFLQGAFTNIAGQFPSSSPLSDPLNFWYPAFTFGFLGSLQWLFIPKTITLIRMRTKAKTANNALVRDAGEKPPAPHS